MPTRKKPKRKPSAPRKPARSTNQQKPPTDELAKIVFRDAPDLASRRNPLDAEMFASQILGISYKIPLAPDMLAEMERDLRTSLVALARKRSNAPALAVMRAMAHVEPETFGTTADELSRTGIPEPGWFDDLDKVELLDAWVGTHPFDDQDVYYSTWQYPGSEPHVLSALYDRNLGGIVKDCFVGYFDGGLDEIRSAFSADGMTTTGIDPGVMAARILAAIAVGDMFIDNEWTQDFKDTRLLLRTRMLRLPFAEISDPEPLSEHERDALFFEFASSRYGDSEETTERIVQAGLRARCDYGDGDPLRWSPIVAELFLLDFLPRKEMLDLAEIRATPGVLKRWVRFALTKRGLTEDLIRETEEAVDRFVPEFKAAATDQSNFGPAKALFSVMQADGIDIFDADECDAWIEAFNGRPFEERDALFRSNPLDGRT